MVMNLIMDWFCDIKRPLDNFDTKYIWSPWTLFGESKKMGTNKVQIIFAGQINHINAAQKRESA
jgi:hypothetical protein